MKTTKTVLAALALMGLVACEKGNKADEFHSPDLSTFFLQGHVQTLFDGSATITFDEQGRITNAETGLTDHMDKDLVFNVVYDKLPGGSVVGGSPVKRDEQGRILWLGCNNMSCSGEEGYHFEYDVEEAVMRYWFDTGWCYGQEVIEVKKTDENGNPLQEVCTYGDEEMCIETVIDYKYTEFDNHGNWTERKLKLETTTTTYSYDMDSGDEDEGQVEKETSEDTQTRTITYYE